MSDTPTFAMSQSLVDLGLQHGLSGEDFQQFVDWLTRRLMSGRERRGFEEEIKAWQKETKGRQ